MNNLDALVRLWRTGKIQTEDLLPDERRRVHDRLLEQHEDERVHIQEIAILLKARAIA